MIAGRAADDGRAGVEARRLSAVAELEAQRPAKRAQEVPRASVISFRRETGYLFWTRGGVRLPARGVQLVFRSLKEKLLVDIDNLHPHLLRHSFALAYIENGGDPFSIQRILGHTNQETTTKYVNMARANVKSQHSKYSPGERLG